MTQLMSPQTATKVKPAAKKTGSKRRRNNEPSVQDIIAAARKRPQFLPARGAWLLSGLTAGLLWASFMPMDFGPLAWIALVPLLLLVRIPQKTKWMYAAVGICGIAGMTASLQWMRCTRRGFCWRRIAVSTCRCSSGFHGLPCTDSAFR